MTGTPPADAGQLAQTYLAYLSGERPIPPPLDDLPADERLATTRLFEALSTAWHHDADAPPALAEDPLAVTLGLVPDPARPLSGPALKRARMSAGHRVSELARALQARGWQIDVADVAAWERQSHHPVMPAIIAALSDELGATVESLCTAGPPRVDDVASAVARTPRFRALSRRWAELTMLPDEVAAASSLRQLMTIGHARRGAELDVEQWLDVLEALVDARRRAGPTS